MFRTTSWLKRLFASTRPIRRPTASLNLLVLEERAVPATFSVNTTDDISPISPVPGETSLRQAVAMANASADPTNTIYLPCGPGIGSYGVYNDTDQLTISNNMTIEREPGSPAGYMPVIDGENDGRAFDISDAGLSDPISVSLDHLTIQHGLVVSGAGDAQGGAIRFIGSLAGDELSLTTCTIDNNAVQALTVPAVGAGGAIYTQDVSLNLTDTLVISNSATGAPGATGGMGMGGGVYASGGAVFMQGVDIAAR